MQCSPRQPIRGIKPSVHGGVGNENFLDFSVCVNPFPPPPDVIQAVCSAELTRYPDPQAENLKTVIAGTYGIDRDFLMVTNGSTQAFWLVAITYLNPGDKTLVFSPGYGDYRVASEIMGARVEDHRLEPESSFEPNPDLILKQIKRDNPKIIWVCNPNNPTGVLLNSSLVEAMLIESSGYGGIVVLDEAYMNFVETGPNSIPMLDTGNLILIRSMTKDFGIPGIRLGYLAARRDIIAHIHPVQPTWSINSPAQTAGIAVLNNLSYYRKTWIKLRRLTEELMDGIKSLGLRIFPTSSNYFLIQTCPDRNVVEKLKLMKIAVRSCASFGLPGYIRIGTRLKDENQRLLSALEEIF